MITERRYDIDWLRVIAIGLLLIYHIAIGFQPWGVFIGFIQSNDPLEAIWIPMSMLNIWRIPLLFFVSGMGVWFAIQRRDWKQLLVERSKRILLPFVFGMAIIVPLHVFLWQDYYSQDLEYSFSPAHLWFLGNIFVYVLVLSPVFFYLKNNENGKVQTFIKKLISGPFGLLVISLLMALEAEIIKPEEFEVYALTRHGFFLGFIAFFLGFCCVYSGEKFWKEVTKKRWALLVTASILYVVRLAMFDLRSPDYLMAVESANWIFTMFGFAHKYLNRSSRALIYLSKAAYPIYIIHMAFLYLGSYFLFVLNISSVVNFILLNLFTFIGCLITYEFVIKRVRFLRPLFGLKLK